MSEALAGGLVGGGTMFLTGLLIMWMGGRMEQGRFRRNRWAGIRTPGTMRSDEAWAAAHEVGGPWLSRGGLLGAVGGLCGLIGGLLGASVGWVAGFILGGAGAMTVMLLVGTAAGVRAARRVP